MHVDPSMHDKRPSDRGSRKNRGTLGMAFVLVLTVMVVAFALMVAIWMYWLAGATGA